MGVLDLGQEAAKSHKNQIFQEITVLKNALIEIDPSKRLYCLSANAHTCIIFINQIRCKMIASVDVYFVLSEK